MMVLQPKFRRMQSIPAASMADIAFLLIIFFMLTSSYSKDRAQVQLPLSTQRQEIPQRAIVISILADNSITINNELVDKSVLFAELQKEAIEGKTPRQVILKADKSVRFHIIDDIMDRIRDSKIRSVYIPTKPELNGPRKNGPQELE